PDPAPPLGAGVQLVARFDSLTVAGATVTRTNKPEGPLFGANVIRRGADGQEEFKGLLNTPANEAKGQLRLVRTGTTLPYQLAEGMAGFRPSAAVDVATGDVTAVRCQCYTGFKQVPLDDRLSDLALRADRIQRQAAEALPTPPPVETAVSRGWLLVVELAG